MAPNLIKLCQQKYLPDSLSSTRRFQPTYSLVRIQVYTKHTITLFSWMSHSCRPSEQHLIALVQLDRHFNSPLHSLTPNLDFPALMLFLRKGNFMASLMEREGLSTSFSAHETSSDEAVCSCNCFALLILNQSHPLCQIT